MPWERDGCNTEGCGFFPLCDSDRVVRLASRPFERELDLVPGFWTRVVPEMEHQLRCHARSVYSEGDRWEGSPIVPTT